MNNVLATILRDGQSIDEEKVKNSLEDLRLLVERFTMDRYGDEEKVDYLILFHNPVLIDYKLSNEEFEIVRYYLIFILFNFPDRTVLVAKCIKVLFDKSLRLAISSAIELFMFNDNATCELIFGITDIGEYDYFENNYILDTFKKVLKEGGNFSKEAVTKEFIYYKNNHNVGFNW